MEPISAAIIGGTALAGGLASSVSQGKMNRRSVRFQREMFDKTNLYNSPLEQRKRLEAAGLNPNLVYGGSAGGASGTASQPAQPDLKAVDWTQPGAQVGEAAAGYIGYRRQQSQIEVQDAQKDNLKQDTINKSIDAVNKAIKSASGSLDYKTKARLYNNTVKTAEERLRNLSVSTDHIGNKDAREHAITQESIRKLRQETSNLRKQGTILSEEAQMKKIDRHLYENYRIRPSDPLYYKILGEILDAININPFKH